MATGEAVAYVDFGTEVESHGMTAFMSAHISAVPNHQVGRVTSFETKEGIAFCGQFGYELDVAKMTEEE